MCYIDFAYSFFIICSRLACKLCGDVTPLALDKSNGYFFALSPLSLSSFGGLLYLNSMASGM
jgi:hypothetical protein